MKKKKCNIQKPQEAYVFEYPEFVTLAKKQNSIFWTEDEIKVEKDIQDIRVNMTDAEREAVIFILRLFTKYEIFAGEEYWSSRVPKMFPRHDIIRMANAFSYFELNVHAPFYNKLNEALHIATEEFHNSWKDDELLVERMEFIDSFVKSNDDLLSLAVFSMIEGVVLYSSFAFLKHFQSKGKNKLMNVVRGINFSVRDENLHSVGGAALFKALKDEMQAEAFGSDYFDDLEEKILSAANAIYQHESQIIKRLFQNGKIEGITDRQMENFVKSRINNCLNEFGMKNLFDVKYNPIAEWFYDGINAYQMNDFFTGIGSAYNRDWDETNFVWDIDFTGEYKHV